MAVHRTYPDAESVARQALAALSTPSQHARLIRLDAPVEGLVVERFEGSEAVCAPFRFEVDVLATSAFLDPDDLLGQPLALRLAGAGGRKRRWHGLCTAVAPLGGDGGLARYRLLVEPWTALLTHRRNALVFQDLDLRGVLEQLFADYPQADWRFDVTRQLPVRAITTQYRESDWEFVTRLLADAGLAWRYEHAQAEGEDGAGAGHTLVVFDQQAEAPEGRALRFHRVDATERDDAISAFTRQRRLVPSRSQVGSWHSERLASTTGIAEADPSGLPALEVYTQPGDGRFEDSAHAAAEAGHRLDAMRLPQELYSGSGSVRDLAAGVAYSLVQHSVHEGAGFVPLNVAHVGVNNLGSGITALLAAPDLEHGSYRNRFVAIPAGVPIAPLPRPRPTVHGPQTARVVGLPEAAVTPNRDHRVRIQFAWQRGPAPNPGGLTDTASSHPGHAPGDATSGTWVPVAEWLAGPNWGSHFLPRIGAEVLVEFAHGDIDQPRITGQLYNGEVAPPFAGGIDGASNHPGTLSGLHTQSHDAGGTQQWVVDDTPGQLRTRLHTSLADSRLELGYLIDHGDTRRGGLRGEGVELASEGWGNVHAGQGLLLSTTARPGATSTQLDIGEAVAQLKGAERTAGGLDDTLCQQQVPGFSANEQLTALREAIDPEEQGCYSGSVNGQSAMKPAGGGREPGEDPVERFADPKLVAESPESIALATQKSAVAYAGGSLHLTVQQDGQFTAGQTLSSVSGQHAALYAHAGPIRAIAANGPVSLQAHTDKLELLADQSVSVTATDERIDVLAAEKIVLQAGQTKVTLEGGNITFECPGNFTVKGAQGPFRGGALDAPRIAALPDSAVELENWIEIDHRDPENEPFAGQAYKIFFAGGQIVSGKLDENGHARHENVPDRAERVEYEPRTPEKDDPPEPLEKLIAAAQSRLG
ncbi:type VI secretion system Vgr family protein [Luteimonas dalianensis]|uniref:type VI secretion system Vgr family protein n=1 Tax=Luteimonas dalianensis TaxID=1148196 RepID=UPI003BF17B2F